MTRLLFSLTLFGSLLFAFAGLNQTPTSTAPSRSITATASCTDTGTAGQPEVTVTIANQSGAPLVISYLHGFTTPQALQIQMAMTDPGQVTITTVPDQGSQEITAPWDDLRTDSGDVGAALVVTNLGVLTPFCDGIPATLTLGPVPASAADAKLEAVQIAAKTLGQLESWRAYPALYALLHPDVQPEVTFPAVACWYANQYGTVAVPLDQSVHATTVSDVQFAPWTWTVTGKTYPDAAVVTTIQQIGSSTATQPVTATEHLVLANGQWRWFFGLSREAIAAQQTGCNLGPPPAAPSATPDASTVIQPPSTPPTTGSGSITGSVEVIFYDCQPGLTPDTFDASACAPMPEGFNNVTLTPGPDVDPSALPGGPNFAVISGTNLGNGAFLISGLPAGTYTVGPGQNYTGPLFYAPDGMEVADSTYQLTISAENPTPTLTLYRLSGGLGSTSRMPPA